MNIDQDSAQVRIPPPIFALSFCLLGYLIHRVFPWGPGEFHVIRGAGFFTIAAGLGILLSSATLFRKFHTNIEPWKKTSTLIKSGIYAYSRNPIYLAFLILGIGIGLVLYSFWIILAQLPLIYVLDRYVIQREENYLSSKFGQEYLQYQQQVRRWL